MYDYNNQAAYQAVANEVQGLYSHPYAGRIAPQLKAAMEANVGTTLSDLVGPRGATLQPNELQQLAALAARALAFVKAREMGVLLQEYEQSFNECNAVINANRAQQQYQTPQAAPVGYTPPQPRPGVQPYVQPQHTMQQSPYQPSPQNYSVAGQPVNLTQGFNNPPMAATQGYQQSNGLTQSETIRGMTMNPADHAPTEYDYELLRQPPYEEEDAPEDEVPASTTIPDVKTTRTTRDVELVHCDMREHYDVKEEPWFDLRTTVGTHCKAVSAMPVVVRHIVGTELPIRKIVPKETMELLEEINQSDLTLGARMAALAVATADMSGCLNDYVNGMLIRLLEDAIECRHGLGHFDIYGYIGQTSKVDAFLEDHDAMDDVHECLLDAITNLFKDMVLVTNTIGEKKAHRICARRERVTILMPYMLELHDDQLYSSSTEPAVMDNIMDQAYLQAEDGSLDTTLYLDIVDTANLRYRGYRIGTGSSVAGRYIYKKG